MIFKIICILIWISWFIYSILGRNIVNLKVGLFFASLVCILSYLQQILVN